MAGGGKPRTIPLWLEAMTQLEPWFAGIKLTVPDLGGK